MFISRHFYVWLWSAGFATCSLATLDTGTKFCGKWSSAFEVLFTKFRKFDLILVLTLNFDLDLTKANRFYQRVSIGSYANRWYSQRRNVRLSVRPSVTLRYCIKTKKASVMISSPSKSPNILVSGNVRLIPKFDRGHPERGQFMRLGWIKIGNFDDFSTNKPPHHRNGAR